MSTAGPSLLVALAISIVLIIVLCGRFRLHPFLAIVIATYGFGLVAMGIGAATGADKPFVDDLGATIAEGFGSILA
ncbi:GntP family permease, partial [Streptomyces sp. SID7499]|nr:GntP family permease [Streptomyces sp. SID7499]